MSRDPKYKAELREGLPDFFHHMWAVERPIQKLGCLTKADAWERFQRFVAATGDNPFTGLLEGPKVEDDE